MRAKTMRIELLAATALILTLGPASLPARAADVKEKADDTATLAEEDHKPLFDGKTLEGWQGNTSGYEAVDGVLVCKKKGGGKLFTKNEYADFSLRFDFRNEAGGNNGVGIRAPLEGDAAYAGMEIQVLDDDHPKYAKLKEYQYHGSIYGVAPAERGHLKPAGEWNSEEIICRGDRVQVILNGHTIVDADIGPYARGEKPTIDGRKHPGLARKKGHIGFLGHGHRVEFRNIRLQAL